MRLIWSTKAWDHYLHWQANDPDVLEKINAMIKECVRTPFAGAGKPEPLKGELKGFWSRRITREHRLVYRVEGAGDMQSLQIAACRYHYF